jgi:cell shape determining protein, MreB/Mrl family
MLGRTPGNIVAVRPLRQGVISDYTVTEKMLKYFIQKAVGKQRFRKPLISICVPSGVTEVERKAVEDAAFQAGARDVKIIEEPIAAAIGAGIDIARPCGNMIVDIGGGTSDIAVISLGGTVVSTSIKIAGDDFDDAIVRYMRKRHNLLIGERTAEDIKIRIGSAFPRPEVEEVDVRGRNLVTGLPKTITVTSEETEEALKDTTLQIVEAVHSVLEKTPPELAADIADRGIVLTGGGSLLYGLEELIESKTGITTMTAEEPMTAVAIGTGKYVEFLSGTTNES